MTQETSNSRRSFLRGGLLAGAAGATALAAPQVSRAQTVTIKMQGAWPDANVFSDFAKQYVDRVNGMSGGRMQIDYLPSGAVVKAFQIQDAVTDGVLDAGHHVTAYWYGKNKAASLFGTGPVFGANASQMLAWIQYGGGKALYDELIQDILGLNLVGFFAMPMPTQPLGWFKKQVNSIDDMKGLKWRTVGLAADVMQQAGVNCDPASGRRDRAGAGARRDRSLRVQQPDLGQPVRRAGCVEGLLHVVLSPGRRVLRDHLQQGCLRRSVGRSSRRSWNTPPRPPTRRITAWRWTGTRPIFRS